MRKVGGVIQDGNAKIDHNSWFDVTTAIRAQFRRYFFHKLLLDYCVEIRVTYSYAKSNKAVLRLEWCYM